MRSDALITLLCLLACASSGAADPVEVAPALRGLAAEVNHAVR